MPNKGPFQLKRTPADAADAILQTFNHKWCDPLLAGRVHVVFRKQGPTNFTPTLMYVYASAPVSAIVARAPILSYEKLPTAEVMELTQRGAIAPEELESYCRLRDTLVVMGIGQVSAAKSPITFSFLAEHYNFWPSSTFIPLSASGVKTLDRLGQFRVLKKGAARDD